MDHSLVTLAPGDRDAFQAAVAKGGELLKQGRFEDALATFRAALALDDHNPRILALLGLTHFRANEFEAARDVYEQLVALVPDDASHRLNLGLVYLKLGDAARAIEALEASRATDPSQGRATSYLGLAYARAGRYAEAYRAFLLAGQRDLAAEIELNLTATELDAIRRQLARAGIDSSTGIPVPRSPSSPLQSSPAINVTRTESAVAITLPRTMTPARTQPPSAPPPRRAASTGEPPAAPAATPSTGVPVVPSNAPDAPRMSESLQFVLPSASQAVPVPQPGASMVSQAISEAAPSSSAAAGAAARVPAGSSPPLPLSQLATDELVRPEDGDEPFELSASGALVIRTAAGGPRVLTRLDGVHVTGGDLAYTPARRRSRGHLTDDPFDYGGSRLQVVDGAGYLIALPGDAVFTAVALDDDILYLREDLVFAFQASLRWENGNVPGLRGRLPIVQFRGDGALVVRSGKPLVRVKLPAQGVLLVDVHRLAGWIGRVIPRAVVPAPGGPMREVCVECSGEGIVLLDPVGDVAAAATTVAEPRRSGEPSRPPPPPPPQASPPRDSDEPELILDDDPADDARDQL